MSDYFINTGEPVGQLLFSTVQLCALGPDGSPAWGTGFFFRTRHPDVPDTDLLITNKHVIDGASALQVVLHGSPTNEGTFSTDRLVTLRVDDPLNICVHHPNPDIDLAALPVADLHRRFPDEVGRAYYEPIHSSQMPASLEDRGYPLSLRVFMIGYPLGLADTAHNLPLLRRGTFATHPSIEFQGRREFLVDIACFPPARPSWCMTRGTSATSPTSLWVCYTPAPCTNRVD